MSKQTELYGTLETGIVGPGGETTGALLRIGNVEVDVSGLTNVRVMSADRATVAGEWETRHWPLRGTVRVLRAKAIAADPAHLSKTAARSSVILSGALETGIVGPGGETTGVRLTGVAPDADVHGVDPKAFAGKAVVATGHFAPKHYVLRGLQYVFVVARFEASADTGDDPPATGLTKISAVGYSDNFSVDEALRDAIANLPKGAVPIDYLLQPHVESIDAEIGGIAGLHRVRVSVSAQIPGMKK